MASTRDAILRGSPDHDVSAEISSRTSQQQRIEAQRAQLLQAHGVLRCLYEVLLHAEATTQSLRGGGACRSESH
jgi:hypothetical protein